LFSKTLHILSLRLFHKIEVKFRMILHTKQLFMKKLVVTFLTLMVVFDISAQVPQLVNYQGRIQVGTENFDGIGFFKFALMNPGNGFIFWTNDGTGINDGTEPLNAVPVRVTKGLYSVLLGDATLENMHILTSAAFASGDVYLRIWFNDGTTGFQLLRPDQRFAAVGYAMMASSVLDGSITTAKLAPGSVKSAQLDDGAVTSGKLANGAVTGNNLALASVDTVHLKEGAVSASKLADGSVGPAKVDGGFSLWNKVDTSLSYSAGNVGIGVLAPGSPLEIASANQTLALLNGSSTGGTWLNLRNGSPGGQEWSIVSSGSANAEGPGKLLFVNGGLKMQLDSSGNLSVAGNVTAPNVSLSPLIQFSQGNELVTYANEGDTKNIDEISMVLPGAGFVQITAAIENHLASQTTVDYEKGEFAFVLYDTTPSLSGGSEQRELCRAGSVLVDWSTGFRVEKDGTLMLSWVLPVDGPKTISLRTQGTREKGDRVHTTAHSLVAVYFGTRANGTSSH
jgi:hypothetical protein